MRLSKNIIERENAKKVAINYKPKAIGSQISEQALEYIENFDTRGDFRVDKVVAEYIGIGELEKESQKKEVAQQALEMTKEIQEKAYSEAYELGLSEGKDKAYSEQKEKISVEMGKIRELVEAISIAKTNIFRDNEKQIANLCFYMAKRLLMKEVEANEEYILTLIKKSLEMAQSDGDVTIKVSLQDKKWIEAHEETIFKELSIGSTIRIESDEEVNPGGVIVETNHGEIDATLEQRLEKLETTLKRGI